MTDTEYKIEYVHPDKFIAPADGDGAGWLEPDGTPIKDEPDEKGGSHEAD